jgi:hypothetical protein
MHVTVTVELYKFNAVPKDFKQKTKKKKVFRDRGGSASSL